MAEKKGPLTTAGLSRGPDHVPRARADAWDRRRDDPPAARRDRGADRQPGLADRSRQRRSLPRRELDAGRRRRLSEHHRAGRVRCTGLPVGLAFIGRAWSEQKLIALAYAFEQATKHRQPPTVSATVPSLRRDGHGKFRLPRNSLKLAVPGLDRRRRSDQLEVVGAARRFDDGRAHAETRAVVLLGRAGTHLGHVGPRDIEQRDLEAVDGPRVASWRRRSWLGHQAAASARASAGCWRRRCRRFRRSSRRRAPRQA